MAMSWTWADSGWPFHLPLCDLGKLFMPRGLLLSCKVVEVTCLPGQPSTAREALGTWTSRLGGAGPACPSPSD